MKSREEMLKEVRDFQNDKYGFEFMNEEDTLDFCVKLVHEIFVQKKHKYEPDLRKENNN
ncbi:hypothetical protein BC30090_p407 (plasmid) [Bacillus cereus]|uniref:hypothetical protein n=1 Tax=Bacillus TaxID=1386 RepID=UPI001952E65E|nr:MULTISPECIES: hypothetical protein [Bacillus]BCD26934.1 hypothetical protein BC30090_p407 [Bacillus cereus]